MALHASTPGVIGLRSPSQCSRRVVASCGLADLLEDARATNVAGRGSP